MTRQEIEALIDKKIAGQGTAIDAGSVFPSVLKGIISNSAETSEVDDFEEFSTSTAYSAGDIVRKEGKLYKFTASKDAGAWDSTKVSATSLFGILTAIIGDLSQLATTEKSSIVGAINELASS